MTRSGGLSMTVENGLISQATTKIWRQYAGCRRVLFPAGNGKSLESYVYF
jgi:hypothetical protein